LRILNGGDKCTPACDNCCPNCPFCESCCQACEECPECEICEECPECGACEECPECPECPTCPCYGLKWGNLLVDFQMWNIGNIDVMVDGVCFTISFEDGTEIKRCIDLGDVLLVGEDKVKQAEINLPTPIKRVVFVEVKSYEFY